MIFSLDCLGLLLGWRFRCNRRGNRKLFQDTLLAVLWIGEFGRFLLDVVKCRREKLLSVFLKSGEEGGRSRSDEILLQKSTRVEFFLTFAGRVISILFLRENPNKSRSSPSGSSLLSQSAVARRRTGSVGGMDRSIV